MSNEFRGKMNKLSEKFNKEITSIKEGIEIETIKKNQSEMKNITSYIKSTLDPWLEWLSGLNTGL